MKSLRPWLTFVCLCSIPPRAEGHAGHGPAAAPTPQAMAAAAAQPTSFLRGKAYYEIGAMDRALAELDAALREDSRSAEALRFRAMVHTHERRFPLAFTDFQAALALRPPPPLRYDVLYYFGDAYFNAGVYDKAAAQFEAILAEKPSHADARCYLGEALAKQGRHEAAVAAFRKAIESDPKSAWAHHSLADALAALGRQREAIEEYRADLALVPHCHTARLGLARALERNGDLDGAIREYYTSIAFHLGDAEAHNAMARIFYGRGEYARSVGEYARTLDFDPSNADARQGIEAARRGLLESACKGSAANELIFWRYVGSWLPAALVAALLLYARRRDRGG